MFDFFLVPTKWNQRDNGDLTRRWTVSDWFQPETHVNRNKEILNKLINYVSDCFYFLYTLNHYFPRLNNQTKRSVFLISLLFLFQALFSFWFRLLGSNEQITHKADVYCDCSLFTFSFPFWNFPVDSNGLDSKYLKMNSL